jgi:hypothetical protein
MRGVKTAFGVPLGRNEGPVTGVDNPFKAQEQATQGESEAGGFAVEGL